MTLEGHDMAGAAFDAMTAYSRAEEKTLEELFGPPADAMEEDVMTQAQFDALLEYSCTLPTGTIIGKKWKRDANEPRRFHRIEPDAPKLWWTGEYTPHPDPDRVGIKWRRVVIVNSKPQEGKLSKLT